MVQKKLDPDLYEKCLKLMRSIFNISDYKNKKIEKDSFGHYVLFLHDLHDEVKDSSSYIDCKSYMENNDVIGKHIYKMVGIWNQMRRTTEWEYLSFLIFQQLIQNNGIFSFNEKVFNNSYMKLENFFYNDKIKFKICLRLINFDAEFNELEVSRDIRIKKIDEIDYMVFYNLRTMFEQWSQYVIEYTYFEEKVYDELPKQNRKKEQDRYEKRLNKIFFVLNVMKLYKKGRILTGSMYSTIYDHIITFGSLSDSPNQPLISFHAYTFTKADIEPFIDLWKKINKYINKYSEFEFSLRRFGHAIEKRRYDDKLIDLVISIESLMLKKGEYSELTYRLSLRIAKLLYNDVLKRIEVQKDLKELYRLRGVIIHGKKYRLEPEKVELCEDYLRNIFVKYLNKRKKLSHDEFLNKIDIEY